MMIKYKTTIKDRINELTVLIRLSDKKRQKPMTEIGYRIAHKEHFKLVGEIRRQKELLEKLDKGEIYYCLKCNKVHKKGTKIFKNHKQFSD